MTVLSPKTACDENAAHLTAIMLREADEPGEIASVLSDRRFTAALIGPAAGVNVETKAKTLAILASSAGAVLDADALTIFEEDPKSLLAALRPDDVMTPHGGEFARLFPALLGIARIKAARMAAATAKCVVVLKGADTIIAAPDGRLIVNTNAPFDLATAGSGDVLAGIIAGMRAQGMPGFEAAAAGVWLHGAAGQVAGPGLIAEDLTEALPQVLRALFSPPPQKPAQQDAGQP